MSRGNGEGTVYETIQKLKKEFDNTNMCKICSECTDRSLCNQRQGWEKCDKCKKCKGEKDCDRFYIYKKTFAQISTNEGRKTVGSGKTKKEVNIKKDEQENKIKLRERINHGNLTLEEAMRENEKQKLKNRKIVENSYIRNLNTIDSICSHYISQIKMIDIDEETIKECLLYFVELHVSQSSLDKIYDEIKSAFKMCSLSTMNNIKRDDYLSDVEKKNVIAFTLEEEKRLLNYINKNENKLVANKSNIDCKTVANLIKILLATGMRIGEACSLSKLTDIDTNNKKIIVHTTLTRDLSNKTIIGNQTKTGRKKKQARKKDERYIPFGILFDENDISNIIEQQYKVSDKISKNAHNLLFCTKDGKLISHSSFNYIFKRICNQAQIKMDLVGGCNTHMTKHTAVTRMVELGIRLEVISVLVGTSVEVLRKTYAHILDDFVEKEIEKSIKNRDKNLSLN